MHFGPCCVHASRHISCCNHYRIHHSWFVSEDDPAGQLLLLLLLLIHINCIVNEVITVKFEQLPGVGLHGLTNNTHCISHTLQSTQVSFSMSWSTSCVQPSTNCCCNLEAGGPEPDAHCASKFRIQHVRDKQLVSLQMPMSASARTPTKGTMQPDWPRNAPNRHFLTVWGFRTTCRQHVSFQT